MIRYALKCEHGHEFESWFQSGSAFDSLRASGLLECPGCGSHKIDKALMTPRLGPERDAPAAATAGPAAPVPVASAPPTGSGPEMPEALRRAMAELRAHVEKNSDYVGGRFAEEARAMHDGRRPERAIHGEARPEEARALIEDGIQILPLPFRDRRGDN